MVSNGQQWSANVKIIGDVRSWNVMEGHGRSWKVMEGHGWSCKVMECHGSKVRMGKWMVWKSLR